MRFRDRHWLVLKDDRDSSDAQALIAEAQQGLASSHAEAVRTPGALKDERWSAFDLLEALRRLPTWHRVAVLAWILVERPDRAVEAWMRAIGQGYAGSAKAKS